MTGADTEEPVGRLIITWPMRDGRPLMPYAITLTDADTGEQITTAVALTIKRGVQFESNPTELGTVTISADCRTSHPVTAEVTMFCDEDGRPVIAGAPQLDEDGRLRTATFRWLVVEMR